MYRTVCCESEHRCKNEYEGYCPRVIPQTVGWRPETLQALMHPETRPSFNLRGPCLPRGDFSSVLFMALSATSPKQAPNCHQLGFCFKSLRNVPPSFPVFLHMPTPPWRQVSETGRPEKPCKGEGEVGDFST